MKPRLIIISDIHGLDGWLDRYISQLNQHYEIEVYDSRHLAGISSQLDEDAAHRHFVNGGISKAVNHLMAKDRESTDVLAFSIGGTIAWKAALAGLRLRNLWAVSSTRLRIETKVPATHVNLYYGSDDPYAPELNWFHDKGVYYQFLQDKDHLVYKEIDFTADLSEKIISSIKQLPMSS
ncbi:alpha/beta hydrolase [Fulvivirga sp. RKSG066]|uniref:alpha/beta hydrolase n=1 Tax=Fulvivirga aurantia TaxID=2529383 RepID=UPI0012BBEAED|nr:alpha/beta hydrolase [Fulvivirga aurantia]MTI20358.1 alpha/beta hydrolase [Fulvivirga aurantia]